MKDNNNTNAFKLTLDSEVRVIFNKKQNGDIECRDDSGKLIGLIVTV